MTASKAKRSKGFSIVELVVAMAVVLIISAIAMPKVVNSIYSMRLRSSAYELSGLMQAARMQAVRDNTYYYVCYATSNNITQAWITNDGTCPSSSLTATVKQVQFGGNVTISSSSIPNASNLTGQLSFTPTTGSVASAKPAFGPRGVPCYVVSSRCDNIVTVGGSTQTVSFILYQTDARTSGSNGWAALTVSPSGRTQVWMYSGTTWRR
jgi:prepilin-type N-terminal cleavage/methylation domain-containing protein